MKLITKCVSKFSKPEGLYNYLYKNYTKLGLNEIDMVIDSVCERENIEYLYKAADLLNQHGYNKKISNIICSVCNSNKKETSGFISSYVYKFMEDFGDSIEISDDDFKMLKAKFLACIKCEQSSSIRILRLFLDIKSDPMLSEDKKFVQEFIICSAKYLELYAIFELLSPGSAEEFVDNNIREYLIEVASDKLMDITNVKSKNYNKDEHDKSISLIFDYYTEKFKNLEVKDEYSKDKLTKEKENMLLFTIAYAPKDSLVKIINDNKYIIGRDYISYIIDELINREDYYELLLIITKKIQINTHYGVNNISDGDVDSIINCICKTHNTELIYDLAENIWNGANEKQQNTIRKLILKSNEPEYIIKFSLYIDKNIIPYYFRKIEKFYNYAKENENKVGKEIVEDILDPKALTLYY